MKKIIVLLIKTYQWVVSPFLPRSCRFTPSCSEYALHALEKHGTGKGGVLALRRLLRCHPFSKGGFDPA